MSHKKRNKAYEQEQPTVENMTEKENKHAEKDTHQAVNEALNESQEKANAEEEGKAGEAASVQEVQEQLDKLTEENEALKDKYLRMAAEFDNYRKRTRKEKEEWIVNGGERTITNILPVLDDLERALKTMENATDIEAIKEGIQLVYNKFIQILEQNGVKPIETADQPLNTDYHEAIAVVEVPDEEQKGKILDCIQTGYTLHNKVIRYAKVVVGK